MAEFTDTERKRTKSGILVVEDSPSLNLFYTEVVKRLGAEVRSAGTGREAIALLDTFAPDIILLDLNLPDIPGMEILAMLKNFPRITTIVITADEMPTLPAEAMSLGAYDFLVKPVDSHRLRTTVANTVEKLELNAKVSGDRDRTVRFGNFIGASPVMRDIYDRLRRIRNSRVSVFITGESGTGKEVTAAALYELNTERKGKFVAINCAAIPGDIMESIIFGHVKGAFTGAVADRIGAVAEADGGVLFLDEICEMNLDLQAKLLRFLQSGTYRMLGSQKILSVDVRIICATNRDPYTEVKNGRFREDLFYRLFVIPIHLPPLRERDNDVLYIAMHFLRRFAEMERKEFLYFSREATRIMLTYPWPGNVRELQNVIHSAVALYDGQVLTREMLPDNIVRAVDDIGEHPEHYRNYLGVNTGFSGGLPAGAAGADPLPAAPAAGTDRLSPAPAAAPAPGAIPLPRSSAEIASFDEVRKRYVVSAVNACDGSVPEAARRLGLSKSTMYRLLEKWHAEGLLKRRSLFLDGSGEPGK